MDLPKLSLALAAITAIFPCVSSASAENAALNACARAFASSIASPGAAAPAFKLNYLGGGEAGALANYYEHRYTFYMKAQNVKTGLMLARATCAVDRRGVIIALTVDESAPTLTARF
jgi:hypothetical protein